MSKRKKKKIIKEKFFEESAVDKSSQTKTDSQKSDLPNQIKKAVEGLYYISETDAEITPFIGKSSEAVTKEEILRQTGSAADLEVEERDFAEFFTRLTEMQDWFGDEEKETARKFGQLKELLESNLRDLKIFKIGKIQLDVYAVGLDAENNLLGIKTKAVET